MKLKMDGKLLPHIIVGGSIIVIELHTMRWWLDGVALNWFLIISFSVLIVAALSVNLWQRFGRGKES